MTVFSWGQVLNLRQGPKEQKNYGPHESGGGAWTAPRAPRLYRKVFDSVPHWRLLEKLKGLGIRAGGSCCSGWLLLVLSGVPQGSVLGLLSLLMFVNELPLWIKSEIRMFGNDTKVWCTIKTEYCISAILVEQITIWQEAYQERQNWNRCRKRETWVSSLDQISSQSASAINQLNSTSFNGRRYKHLFVSIYITPV